MPVFRSITPLNKCTALISGIYVEHENGIAGTQWQTKLTWSADREDVVFFNGVTSALKFTCLFNGKAGHDPNQSHTVYNAYFNPVYNTLHWRKQGATYAYWDNIWFKTQSNKYVDFLHEDPAFEPNNNHFNVHQINVMREIQTDTRNAIAVINTHLKKHNATLQNIFYFLDFVKTTTHHKNISLPDMLKSICVNARTWQLQWNAYTVANQPISEAESAKFYTLFLQATTFKAAWTRLL